MKPLFSGISSKTYWGAFFLGALSASITGCIAIYYTLKHNDRIEKCKEKKSFYCIINSNNIEFVTFNILIKTFIISMITSCILFILFGFGGGSLRTYYTPTILDLLYIILTICISLFLYFLFHYYLYYSVKKEHPKLINIFYSTLYDLGFVNIVKPDKKKELFSESRNF